MIQNPPNPDKLIGEASSLDRWYLAYTKPRQEQIAQTNLEQQAFEAYLVVPAKPLEPA